MIVQGMNRNQAVVYCEWDKVFLASHSGRAFDPSCSASIVISGVEDDGVHERFIATKPGWRMAVASDKDVYHSFIVRLFLRHELPDIDPFNGEPSEVENELAAFLEKKLKGMSEEQIRQKAREIVDSLRQSVVPDELYELHKELRQNVKIKKDGTEQISAALAKVEALIAFLAPDEKDVSRAADWLARARSTGAPLPRRIATQALPQERSLESDDSELWSCRRRVGAARLPRTSQCAANCRLHSQESKRYRTRAPLMRAES